MPFRMGNRYNKNSLIRLIIYDIVGITIKDITSATGISWRKLFRGATDFLDGHIYLGSKSEGRLNASLGIPIKSHIEFKPGRSSKFNGYCHNQFASGPRHERVSKGSLPRSLFLSLQSVVPVRVPNLHVKAPAHQVESNPIAPQSDVPFPGRKVAVLLQVSN